MPLSLTSLERLAALSPTSRMLPRFSPSPGTRNRSRQATLHLDTNLPARPPCIRMDADQVVAFSVRRSLVGEDVAPHEITDHEVLSAQRDDRVLEELRHA